MSMNFNPKKPAQPQTTRSKIEKWIFIGATVIGAVLVGGILFNLIPSIPALFKQALLLTSIFLQFILVSFGLSSGGGQVRYALIVDDQATAKLNIFKNGLTQVGTTSQTTAGKMAIMNNAFTAGVNPIKNTGDAMNQLVTTHKTLGQQLGGIASGFKNNALAIGAAASSVLGLYQNYANLSSAQNAANKAATAAKAATLSR